MRKRMDESQPIKRLCPNRKLPSHLQKNNLATVEKATTVEDVNNAFKAAAAGALKGVLAVSDEPLVSVDYIGNPASATVDMLSTQVVDGVCVHVASWYDNEWGYSSRCVDLIELVAARL